MRITRRLKKILPVFLLILQILFSFAPLTTLIPTASAREADPQPIQVDSQLKLDNYSGDFAAYYVVDGEIVAHQGSSEDNLELLLASISNDDVIEHQPERLVLKTIDQNFYLLAGELDQSYQDENLELSDDDQDFLYNDWRVDGKEATTTWTIREGVTYKFPLNEQVQLRFNNLPSETSTLTIEEVLLSEDLQLALGALSEIAYDVRTDMENGEFNYDLYLPKNSEDQEVEIRYAQDLAELEQEAKVVEAEVSISDDQVKMVNLDHMTVFVVVNSGTTPPTNNLEIIVDNEDAEYVEAGDWNYSASCASNAYGGSGRFANNSGEKSATWSFQVPEDGNYRVDLSWIKYGNQATNASYVLNYGYGDSESFLINQRGPNCEWSDFVSQGTYFFSAGVDYSITLSNTSADGNVFADAVRLFKVEAPSKVWVDDDWSNITPMYPDSASEVETNKYLGWNAFSTIQEGIDQVVEGGVVNVKSGSYKEQLFINKDLSLLGHNDPVILAPTVRENRKVSGGQERIYDWLVLVEDVESFKIDGFKIDGLNNGDSGRFVGIKIANSRGLVKNNTVTNIRGGEHGSSGIVVNGANSSVDIINNDVNNFKKGGIVANLDSFANIIENTVIGDGQIDTIAQNGIQIGFGASGVIEKNVVQDIYYTGGGWMSCGILLAGSSNIVIEGNKISNSLQGIGVRSSDSVSHSNLNIVGNEIVNSYDGINIAHGDGLILGGKIEGNLISANTYGIILFDPRGWTISENSIKDNYLGIGITSEPIGISINSNDIFSNSYGIWNWGTNLVSATDNWWGDVFGPYHATNPSGTANSVSNNVEFCPWLDAEDGESFGFCIDEANPSIDSISYFKNGLPMVVMGTGEDPVHVQNPGQIEYSAEFSDDLKLGYHVFVVYDEHPDKPGQPHWTSQGGTAYCSFKGINNRYELENVSDELNSISLSDCVSNLDDGTYVVVNRVYDAVGKFSESYDLTFVIDTNMPSTPTGITIFDHEGNNLGCAGYTNNRNIKIDWNDNIEADLAHYLFDIKDKDGHRTLSKSEYSATIRDLDGDYQYKVRAVDQAGNISEAGEWCKITLDRQLPLLNWDTPLNDSIYSGSVNLSGHSNEILNNARFLWRLQGETSWNNSNSYNSNQQQLAYTYTFNPAEDGIYELRFQGRDLALNWAKAANDIITTVDRTKPSLTIESPANDDIISGQFEVIGDASDVTSGIKDIRVVFRNESDDQLVKTCWATFNPGDNSYSLDVNDGFCDVNDGLYLIRVRARDNADNTRFTAVRRITLDNTAPTSNISNPDGDTYHSGPILIEGNTSDSNGVVSVKLSSAPYENEACGEYTEITTLNLDSALTSYDWTHSWTPDSEGQYCIKAQGTDFAGNLEQTAVVKNVIYDKTIPQVDLTVNPADPDGSGNWYITRPEVTLTANDNFEVDYIQYRWGTTGSWSTYSALLQSPAEGTNTLYYKAFDKAGNESEEGIRTLQWDQTELTEGPLNIKADPNPTAESTSTISWDHASDNIGITKYKITWDLRDGDDKHSKEVAGDVTETEIDELEEGSYKITVTAYDGSGYNKSATTNLTVDRSAPVAPVLTLLAQRPGEIDLAWEAIADADRYIIYYGLEAGNYLYAADVGNVTDYTVTGLTAGNYYFIVRAVDESDNQSANSNEVSILDLAGAPTGTIIAEGFAEAGEVQGETTEASEEEQAAMNEEIAKQGEVKGAAIVCTGFSKSLFWLFLAMQAAAILLLAKFSKQGWLKLLAFLALPAVFTVIIMRTGLANCFGNETMIWLTNNYYLPAYLTAMLTKMLELFFIAE